MAEAMGNGRKRPFEGEDDGGKRAPSAVAMEVDQTHEVTWGDWMGAWKVEAGMTDVEQDRLSRAQAAFGGETLARMKDLNVLVIGCRGVGVETAKNLILSNVGMVRVWDCVPAHIEDLGANFYLNEQSVGRPRAAECIGQLKSLNPYCRVEILEGTEESLPDLVLETNVLSSGRGYSAVVVTQLLQRKVLFLLNERARSKGIAFILAINSGATMSMFSDFGPHHTISDEDGEPTQMLAVACVSIVHAGGIVCVQGCKAGERLVVLSLASDHSLQDGDTVTLDDMRGSLACYNGKQLKVKRFGILSPVDAKIDLKDVAIKELLKSSTEEVLTNFSKQYEHYKLVFEASKSEGKFKHREITLFNRLCLVIDDAPSIDGWSSYTSGGLVNSVKPTLVTQHASLEQSLASTANPQMLDQEAWQSGEGCWVQLAIATALQFREENSSWPALLDASQAARFVSMAQELSEERRKSDGSCWLQKVEYGFPSCQPLDDITKTLANLERYAMLFETELTGFCAFLGGVAAQEVIKKTGKFTPLNQWLHHTDFSLLEPAQAGMGRYEGTRYAHQVACIGAEAMDAVRKQRVFLVGCGALGCEYMKGLALMGACSGPDAKLVVTDMDNIEVSNLSRQFLFRHGDIGSAKSTTAAAVVKGWNHELKVVAYEKGVGITSEDFFDDTFWSNVDLCWNALDNVVARKYTDQCCLWYGLPLLESGTLGTKSNSDVFLPGLTKSYNDGVESDSNENQIAMCTLRSFPYLPLHCIEFAKQVYFSDYLEFAPQQYESFRKDAVAFFEQLEAMGDAEQCKALKMIKHFIGLQSGNKIDFNSCIGVAFKHFCEDFITSIRDLVYSCDEIERSSGKPFWTGTKRRPMEAQWPTTEAMEYLYAAANCYAYLWSVPFVRNRAEFAGLVRALHLQVPSWTAPVDTKVQLEEDSGAASVDSSALEALKAELRQCDTMALQPCAVHDFEKDDDSNFHIDFLTVSANLRAANYDIKRSERSQVKVTAGRIIPALATTTAMICGLVDIEFLKLVKGLHKVENPLNQFYNANINLGTGLQAMNVFRPEPAITKPTKLSTMVEFTSWDKIDVRGELSVGELVRELEQRFAAKVVRLLPAENDKVCLYDSTQQAKLNWKIDIDVDGKLIIEPDDVFSAWPQLKMTATMLQRLPVGLARKNFEAQAASAAKALQDVKDTFAQRLAGPVSEAYFLVARPSESEGEKRKYFDAVFGQRKYLKLVAHVLNSAGEEADLPLIRYTFRS